MGTTLAPPPANPQTPLSDRRQHMIALEKANHVRLARAAFKRRLRDAPDSQASRRLAADLISDPPDVLAPMPVLELLEACRRLGTLSAVRLLDRLGISETLPISRLSTPTRNQLIGALRVTR